MCEEPLQCLAVERWHELKAVFKSNWPKGISGYGTLDIEEQVLKNGADYGFKAYVPYGDLSTLIGIHLKELITYTEVAINPESHGNNLEVFQQGSFYEIIIQSIKDDTADLIKALRTTKLIDWTRPLQVPFAPKHIVKAFKAILSEKNIYIERSTTTETFYIKNDAPYFDVKLPPGFKFELLTDEYAEISNETWPHKHKGSVWYYHLLIKAKLGYGLFKNGELVAWCYVKEMGALGHLYTLETHRRRGFGELVLQLISNTLRRDGKEVFAFCVAGNYVARNLYVKLGFSLSEDVDWCDIKPGE